MKDASDYLAYIKALIVSNPQVLRWSVIREEAQGDIGLFRYRLTLRDGSIHKEFSTSPHHVHDGSEGNVQPHEPINAEEIFAIIAENVTE